MNPIDPLTSRPPETPVKRPTSAPTSLPPTRRLALPLLLVAGLLAAPATASAHGGLEVAEGGGGGVRIAVQGSAASTNEVDLATTLTGRGTGKGSKVVYWIRPDGRTRSIRIATQRDETGIHHAEIPVSGRGSWQDWDVSAYATLNTGRTLRVTNDRSDAPGPPPRPTTTAAAPTTTAAAPTTTGAATPTTSEQPTTAAPASAAAVEDVSGEGDGAPGWVIPSIVVLVILGGAAVAVRHRRLPPGSRD